MPLHWCYYGSIIFVSALTWSLCITNGRFCPHNPLKSTVPYEGYQEESQLRDSHLARGVGGMNLWVPSNQYSISPNPLGLVGEYLDAPFCIKDETLQPQNLKKKSYESFIPSFELS